MDSVGGEVYEMVLEAKDYSEHDKESCATGFQAMELPPNLGPMWVFGQTILRKYYSVYDWNSQRVGIGLASHTSKVRLPPTDPPTKPPPKKVEKCEDDNRSMEKSQLPGCTSFAQMGYCKRFPPLAQHYCRLACKLCTPPVWTSSRSDAKEHVADAQTKGNGIVVAQMRRKILGGAEI